jgi:transposase-like protein
MAVRGGSHSGEFSTRQRAAALAIATGASIRSVAKTAGVSTRAVYKWLAQPAYVQLIATERDRVLSRVVGKLVRSAVRAATTLDKLLGASGEPGEGARIRAASAILDAMVRTREHGELAARVAALEEARSHEARRSNQPTRNGRRRLER